MKFDSKKDTLFTTVVFGVNTLLTIIIITGLMQYQSSPAVYLVLLLPSAVIVLLFWIYYNTSYSLSKEFLVYKSGPFRGKIPIDQIREIVKGKTLWVGLRPATAKNGLIIKFNKYDELYISPLNNDTFITQILELQNDIKISE